MSGAAAQALVYQYFGSKEGVYTACVERGRAQMFENLRRAAAEDPPNALRAVVTSYFDQLDEMRGSSYVSTATPRAAPSTRCAGATPT